MDGVCLRVRPDHRLRLSAAPRACTIRRLPSNHGTFMTPITGRTRIWAILADPIAQVKAPEMINAAMAEQGIDGVMVPMHVAPAHLATVLAGLRAMQNCGGMIVTVPHKSAVVALLDGVTETARRVGAANVVRREADGRLIGECVDGIGFVAALREQGVRLEGRSAYLAGAGGAANAIAFALAESGLARLTIANRTRVKAEDLAARLRAVHPHLPVALGTRDPSGHDLCINATALGMLAGDAMPFDPARLEAEQSVCEIIMQPAETPIMAAARDKGCRVYPGLPMLRAQRDLMMRFWR